MAAAKNRSQWTHTSELIAAIYNTVRDPEKRKSPFRGAEFNPYTPKKRTKRKEPGIEAFNLLLPPSRHIKTEE